MSQEISDTVDDVEPTDRSSESSQNDVLVEIRDLKTYYEGSTMFGGRPVKAVDGVSFDIFRGETLGLVGESGCGKTTLGRTLLRLENATGGSVRFDGVDVTTLSGDDLYTWRRNAQMVFQDPDSSLNDRMTVGEIIREPLDVHDWKTPRERRDHVRDLLDAVGLQREHYYRYPHQFSGGQRQRISIARTLALEPEFIVLDEPVSALDVSVQAEIINLLEDLQAEFDLTYLFIAHDLSVVRHICDRVAVMYLGHVMEIGPTEELFSDPANPYTHSLLSAIPEPDPTKRTDRIVLHGTPPNPRYPPSGCPFSTRCPARIRPATFEHVDDEVWSRLMTLREVLHERQRASMTIRERIRSRAGWETRFLTVSDTYEELFGDVDLPEDVASVLEEIGEHARKKDEAGALATFNRAFGSVCDGNVGNPTGGDDGDGRDTVSLPERHEVGNGGRESLCHRHDDDFREPGPVLEERR